MATDIDIANMALSRLGARATIADFGESSAEARAVNTWYAIVRDDLVGKIDWSFARVYQQLAQSGTPPARWTYSYAYPSDCLKMWRLDRGTTAAGAPIPFEVASSGGTRFLFCNESPALAVYSQRVTDANRFPPSFTRALADGLAAAIAYPITQKQEVAQLLEQRAKARIEEAMAEAVNEQMSGAATPPPETMAARRDAPLGDPALRNGPEV